MKILAAVVLILCVTVQVFAVTPEKLDDALEKCANQKNVDKKQLKMALKGQVPDDPKLKEGLMCVSNELQLLNGTEINKEKLKKLLKLLKPDKSDDEIKNMVNMCGNKPGDTPKEKLVNVLKCIGKQ